MVRYIVHCPALKGCWSQGDTVEEALWNIKEAECRVSENIKREGDARLTNEEFLRISYGKGGWWCKL